jgi:hypothetical protein
MASSLLFRCANMKTPARGIHGRILAAAVALWLFTGAASTALPTDPVIVTSVPSPIVTSPRSDSEMNLWRSMGALFLVLCGLLAATYVLKRRGIAGFGALDLRRVRMIEKYPIDTKRALLLVALDDHELLLGVGSDSITPLHSQLRRQPGGEKSAVFTKAGAAP